MPDEEGATFDLASLIDFNSEDEEGSKFVLDGVID
jgi:hypothetical protein